MVSFHERIVHERVIHQPAAFVHVIAFDGIVRSPEDLFMVLNMRKDQFSDLFISFAGIDGSDGIP